MSDLYGYSPGEFEDANRSINTRIDRLERAVGRTALTAVDSDDSMLELAKILTKRIDELSAELSETKTVLRRHLAECR